MKNRLTAASNGCARALRVAGLLAGAAWLAGCTVPSVLPDQALTQQQGAVVLKLIDDSRDGEASELRWLKQINLYRQVNPGEDGPRIGGILRRDNPAAHSTYLYSDVLKPGTYAFRNVIGSFGSTHYTYPLDKFLSTFEVKPGQVTMVGTLVIHPNGGTRFQVGYVPPGPELQQTMDDLYPVMAAQMKGKPVNTLHSPPLLERDKQLAQSFKRAPSQWNGLDQTAEGDFLGGAKLGKVLWRKAGESRWRELDTGAWGEVLSARPYRGGLLAAGEEGLLRLSRDEGVNWTALTPPEHAVIAGVLPLANGKVLAVSHRDRQWNTWVSDDVERGQWRKLGSFMQDVWLGGRPAVTVWQDTLVAAMPNGKVHIVGETSTRVMDIGAVTVDIAALADGTLVSRSAASIASMTTMTSRDGGKTWTDLGTSGFKAIALKDAQTGYAVARVESGAMAGKYALMTSRDGGRSWTPTGEDPGPSDRDGVRRMAVDRSNGALLAFLKEGTVVQSRDEGKSWQALEGLRKGG